MNDFNFTPVFCLFQLLVPSAVTNEPDDPQCYQCSSELPNGGLNPQCPVHDNVSSSRTYKAPCAGRCFTRTNSSKPPLMVYRGCTGGQWGLSDPLPTQGCFRWTARDQVWCFCSSDGCNGFRLGKPGNQTLEQYVEQQRHSGSEGGNSTGTSLPPSTTPENAKLDVDEVMTRLTQMEVRVARMEARLSEKDFSIDQLHGQVSQMNITQQSLEGQLNQMDSTQQSLLTENEGLKTQLQNLKAHLQNGSLAYHTCRRPRVAFTASFNSTQYIKDYNPLVLDEVLVNHGHAYCPSTGKFRAPCSGSFFFSAFAVSVSASSSSSLWLIKNSTSNGEGSSSFVFRSEAHMDGGHFQTGSLQGVVDLQRGDEVWLQSVFRDSWFGYGDYTAFSGFLLH